jgi:predicted outer membrane repeat protein
MTKQHRQHNRTSDQGGGIFATTATITGSTISGNQSTGDQAGGLFLINGTSNINTSTISGNTAVGEGGAMYFNGSPNVNSPAILNITDSTISNNSTGNTGTGGGLYILSFATVTITRSTLTVTSPAGPLRATVAPSSTPAT